jgi:hypothetical protein
MHERSKAQDPSGFWVAEDGDTILGLEVRFAMDSPLEREGFEPSVPRERDGPRAIAKVVSRWALSELMYSLPQVWW